jgi:hypothetical protein
MCRVVAWLLAVLLSIPAAPVRAQQEATGTDEPAAEENEPEALAALLASAEFLARAPRLHFATEVEYDVRQDSGQMLEFGARRSTTLRRPDRLRVEVQNRDGNQHVMFFDGKKIALLDRDENVYATAERAGNIDDVLDFTLEELETPVPLAELLYSDFPARLRQKIQGIYTVGAETLHGVRCQHLALRGDEVDAQFWIAIGPEPLPRRIVLSYKHAGGQPQFRADFVEWDLSPRARDKEFAFEAPEGAEAVPFLLRTKETKEGSQ